MRANTQICGSISFYITPFHGGDGCQQQPFVELLTSHGCYVPKNVNHRSTFLETILVCFKFRHISRFLRWNALCLMIHYLPILIDQSLWQKLPCQCTQMYRQYLWIPQTPVPQVTVIKHDTSSPPSWNGNKLLIVTAGQSPWKEHFQGNPWVFSL